MIPPDKLIVLDTVILVELARGKKAGSLIDAQYKLRTRSEKPLICVVTAGEILALARIWKWGQDKLSILDALLREIVVVDIHIQKVLERYSEIKAYAKESGLAIGDNDTWIAATTSVADAVLLTSDRDFNPLHGKFITREFVDPESLR